MALVLAAHLAGDPDQDTSALLDLGELSIAVQDSGPGVPEAFRPRLFQEYSRAPDSRARGTGLGLFVVRALADAQGGSVTYAPRDPRGSIFTLTPPAARQVGASAI